MPASDIPRASAPDERPRSRPDVVFRRVAGDWLLFDPEAGRIHVLNLAAALVWSHCDGTTSLEEIRARVRDAWQDKLEGDPVADSLDLFHREGLLDSPGAP